MFAFVAVLCFFVVDLCENGTAVDRVAQSPYTTSPRVPVPCSHPG